MPVLLSLTFLVSLHVSGKAEGVYPWIGFTLVMVAGGCYAMAKADPLTGLRVPLILPGLMDFFCSLFLCARAVPSRGSLCGRDAWDAHWRQSGAAFDSAYTQ